MGSGMVLGTDALLPSTLTVKVSAAVGPAVAGLDAATRLMDGSKFPARLIQRRTMPLVSGSSGRLNSTGFFPTDTRFSQSVELSISCLRIHRDFCSAGCPNATACAQGVVRRA